jgi:hypothetical protein
MARCSSAATTDESTPPDNASSTGSFPTVARTCWMDCSMILAVLHKPLQPAISCRNRRRMAAPWRVCVTSG